MPAAMDGKATRIGNGIATGAAARRTHMAAMRRLPVLATLVVALSFAAYSGVGRCGFVNMDDDDYVEHEPMVTRGLRAPTLVWAFTTPHSGTWHPLTTLSHALDCTVFGVTPAPMHRENLVLHAANAVLVFLVWHALFGRVLIAAGVASLFAIHPLNVESVAWISERKNLLSTLFWLLGLGAYIRYARQPSRLSYLGVLAAFFAAILSKPMVVTFPCVLLLLDYWPLRRWQDAHSTLTLLKEKLPLFAMSGVLAVITVVAQRLEGAMEFGRRLSFSDRLGNALVSYVRYLGKAVWPEELSIFYAHPGRWPLPAILGAGTLLGLFSWLVYRQQRRHPWLVFGWCWFLGTLVPVIGIVQSGGQAMADRYMYLPGLGVFTVAVFAGAEWFALNRSRRVAAGTAALMLVALGSLTHRQVGAWRNSLTLYDRSLANGEDNAVVRCLRAAALQTGGAASTAVVAELKRAIELDPTYVNAYTQLAGIAASEGRIDEALQLARENLAREPRNPSLHFNVAFLHERTGDLTAARERYHEVLSLQPRNFDARHAIIRMLARENRLTEAAEHYAILVPAHPWNTQGLTEYGILLANLGRLDEARAMLQRAVWIDPAMEAARTNLQTVDQLLRQRRG